MGILLLVLDSVVQVTSGSTVTSDGGNAATTPSAPLEQPWLLLAAVTMCAISFFLLHQAVKFHEWVTAKDKEAPTATFRVAFAGILSFVMILASFMYMVARHPPAVADRKELRDVVFWYFLHYPSDLAAGFLLGSIVPSAIAIFTFMMAGFIMRDTGQELPPLARSPRAALFGAIISCISFAGSIAGLIRFFYWIKEP